MWHWFLLLSAVGLEVAASSLAKESAGFSRPLPAISAVIIYSVSLFIFSRALQTIPIGIAYAVWAGFGIVIMLLVGLFVFRQNPNGWAYLGIALIIAGTIVASLLGKAEG